MYFSFLPIILVSLLLGKKEAIIYLILTICTYIVLGVGYVYDFIVPNVDINLLVRTHSHWISRIFSMTFFSLIIIVIAIEYLNVLIKEKEKTDESELRFRQLTNLAFEGIVIHNNGICMDVSLPFCNMTGYTLEELNGKNLVQLMIPEKYHKMVAAQLQKSETEEYEIEGVKKSGIVFPIALISRDITWKGEPARVTSVRDITKRKEVERELEKYRESLELLVKERTDELDTAVEELRASNEELYTTNEKINDQKNQLNETLEKLTEAQAQLVQSEKMASIGVLVAGIAHEINNPVNFISTSVYGMKTNLPHLRRLVDLYKKLSVTQSESIKAEIVKEEEKLSLEQFFDLFSLALKNIDTGVGRTTEIVHGMRSFTSANDKRQTTYDIHHNIDNTLIILYNQYKKHIKIKKNYGKIPLIKCFSGQINQVWMNILANAILSIKEKGEIAISTSLNNNMVLVSIKDTGCGMTDEVMSKIFDPFFTTRSVGKGTGLGLSITYNNIKNNKGEIKVKSRIDEGTEFIVSLPLI